MMISLFILLPLAAFLDFSSDRLRRCFVLTCFCHPDLFHNVLSFSDSSLFASSGICDGCDHSFDRQLHNRILGKQKLINDMASATLKPVAAGYFFFFRRQKKTAYVPLLTKNVFAVVFS